MLSDFYEAIKPELITIFVGVLTAILGFVGTKVRKLYDNIVKDEKKEKIVKTVVNAANELYSELKCDERLIKIKENILTMLKENKINVTDFELSMLIANEIQACKRKDTN